MYNKLFHVTSIIFFIFLIASCTKDLDEVSYSNINEDSYTFNENQYNEAIGSVYASLRGIITGGSWYAYTTQEVGTDEMAQPANPSGWSDGGIFLDIERHDFSSEAPVIREFWNALSKSLVLCNRVLEQIENETILFPNNDQKEETRAEMRTARAYIYWLLFDNFGGIPLIDRTYEDLSEVPGNSTREALFKFAVNELKESIPFLSEEVSPKTYARFTKWAAKTILASIYLNAEVYTGEAAWDLCLKEVDDIISSGKFELASDYSDPFKVNNQDYYGSIIFSIPFDAINARGFLIQQQVSFHPSLQVKFGMSTIPYGAGSLKMVPAFGDVYFDSLYDTRLDKTWIRGPQFGPDGKPLNSFDNPGTPLVLNRYFDNGVFTTGDAGWRIGKWEMEPGANDALNNDFPVFRYARVLMMKAECLLKMDNGNQEEAAEIVTEVRRRSYSDPERAEITVSELIGNSVYKYGYWDEGKVMEPDNGIVEFGGLLDELGREFCAEMFRRRDMIRFGVYESKGFLEHKASSNFYKLIFPIPDGVLRSYPNFQQNPGY